MSSADDARAPQHDAMTFSNNVVRAAKHLKASLAQGMMPNHSGGKLAAGVSVR